MIETTCSAKSLIFSEILDLDLRKLSGRVLDQISEDVFFVIANEDDFLDLWDLGNGFEAVPDNWVARDIKQWLRMSVNTLLKQQDLG